MRGRLSPALNIIERLSLCFKTFINKCPHNTYIVSFPFFGGWGGAKCMMGKFCKLYRKFEITDFVNILRKFF